MSAQRDGNKLLAMWDENTKVPFVPLGFSSRDFWGFYFGPDRIDDASCCSYFSLSMHADSLLCCSLDSISFGEKLAQATRSEEPDPRWMRWSRGS